MAVALYGMDRCGYSRDDDKVEKVRAINAGGTQSIADACKKLSCKMTYISTDYVFAERARSLGSRTTRTISL